MKNSIIKQLLGLLILTILGVNQLNAQNVIVFENNDQTNCNGAAFLDSTNLAIDFNEPIIWMDANSQLIGTGPYGIGSLCAGNYSVNYTLNGTVVAENFTISYDPCWNFDLNLYENNQSFSNNCNGQIYAYTNGNANGLSYLWSNGSTTSMINNACLNTTYSCTITNAAGCTNTQSIIVTSCYLSVGVNVSPSITGTCTGSIDLISYNTSATYTWGNGATGSSLTNLCSGTYTYFATGTNGCTAQGSVTVTDSLPNPCTGFYAYALVDDVSLQGVCDGEMTIGTNLGTAPFTYAWSNNSTSAVQSNLCQGTNLSCVVTDANGCQSTTSGGVWVYDPCAYFYVNTSYSATSASTVCDGESEIFVYGGTAPYTYAWSTGQNTPIVIGLCPGIYTVDVTDANGCTMTVEDTIYDPNMAQASVVFEINNAPNVSWYDSYWIEDCNLDFALASTASILNSTPNTNGNIFVTWGIYDVAGNLLNTYLAEYNVGNNPSSVNLALIIYCGFKSTAGTCLVIKDVVNPSQLGITTQGLNEISVVNPFGSELMIDFGKSANYQLSLYDLNGALIQRENIENSSTHTMNTEKLSEGMYILNVASGNEMKSFKIIK